MTSDEREHVQLRGTLIRLGRFVALGIFAALLGSLWAVSVEARYAAMVVDANTGEVLFSRNGQAIRYPASLTKMMTLYLAFDALNSGKLKLDQNLKVSKRAAGQTPSRLGLKAGRTITTRNAILAMVTKSANDAATVVAEAIGGTEVKFAEIMTSKARSMGMRRTTFRNATGLPNRHQRTTAGDMSLLATALLRDHENHYHYFSTSKFTHGRRTYGNHNNLLKTYQGADGIKTGYIRASGFNLVASVRRGDTRLIGIVFGGKSAKSRDSHAKSIFDRAFSIIEARNIPRPAAKPRPPAVATPQLAADAPAEATAPEQGSTSGEKTSKIPQGARIAEAPATTIPGRTWLIQVGAFGDEHAAYRGVRQASEVAARYLEDARVAVSEALLRNGARLYRARIIGISRQNAFSACSALKKRRIDCVALNPIGS